jgi:hypothetical protein
MAATLATTFTQHIRPMFRPQDIACMTKAGVLLADAAWMCDPSGNHGFADHGNARHVYAALQKGVMPPDNKWSKAWLDTFANWMNEGFALGS